MTVSILQLELTIRLQKKAISKNKRNQQENYNFGIEYNKLLMAE